MANETSSEHALASQAAIAVMATVYFSIFVTSELGNGFVIFSLLVRKRRTRTAMDDFVLSLATTDFLFTTLTLFNVSEYILDEWKLRVIACKIHGLLLEVTYAASALTLATISYSRCRAANAENPFIFLRVKPKTKRNIVLIWLTSFVFCLPLLYGYTVVWSGAGSLICTNTNFNEVTRQAYYLAETVLLFVVPITVMIVSQHKTTNSLRSHFQKQPSDVTPATIRRRAVVAERQITKLLKWTWIIFMCCCAPFTTYRTLDYFMHIRKRGHLWKQLWYLGQLLIMLNAAINPFLYHRMTKNGVGDRTKARCVEWCCCCLRHGGWNHVVSTSNQEKKEIKNKTRTPSILISVNRVGVMPEKSSSID